MAFTNDFAWSKSRYGMFKTCMRQYYYRYYKGWGGWDNRANAITKQIYMLGKLGNRWSWVGNVVHDYIEGLLKLARMKKPFPSLDETRETILETMREGFKNSKQKKYHAKPKSVGLAEHEYDQKVPKDEWKKMSEKAVYCAQNFIKSPYMKRFLKDTTKWLEIEELSKIEVNGTPCWVKMDFCAEMDGKLYIIDFKTGKHNPDATKQQLAIYAIYAQEKWKKNLSDIIIVEMNLAIDEVFENQVTEEDLENVFELIGNTADEMRTMLVDEEKNKPMEEELFVGTDNEFTCRFCNFQKVCDVKLT